MQCLLFKQQCEQMKAMLYKTHQKMIISMCCAPPGGLKKDFIAVEKSNYKKGLCPHSSVEARSSKLAN